MAIRGLLLDLDGTLADSLNIMRLAYDRFMSHLNIKSSEQEFRELNGPPLDKIILILKKRYSLSASLDELEKDYMDFIQEKYLHVKPNAGAHEVLSFAKSQGWICAIVTSNSASLARQWLIKNHLIDQISVIIGKEQVKIGKPHPEPYLVALEQLKCLAENSFAVEDSPAGIKSASDAKIKTIAYVPDKKTQCPSDWNVIHSLFDLKDWLNRA